MLRKAFGRLKPGSSGDQDVQRDFSQLKERLEGEARFGAAAEGRLRLRLRLRRCLGARARMSASEECS